MHTFGAGPGGATAATMLAHQLADSTKDAYANKWANFVGFCEASGYPFLPTTTEVVACWVGELYERGTVAPGTLQNYLTPINSVHALYNMDKPAVGPMLMAVRHGFTRLYADNHQGLRDKRAPLPAAAMMQMVNLGLTTPDAALRRRIAGLAMTALTFCRPGGGANFRQMDVVLATSHLLIQVANYKHGARANRERLVIRVPRRPPGSPDPAYDLVRGHVEAMQLAGATPDQPLFAPLGDRAPLPTEVATSWMREGLYLLSIPTPAGCLYSGHSLRSCAATSARAIGLELDAIATLMGMRNKDISTVTAVYVDALVVPDAAARELYDRYLVARR